MILCEISKFKTYDPWMAPNCYVNNNFNEVIGELSTCILYFMVKLELKSILLQ